MAARLDSFTEYLGCVKKVYRLSREVFLLRSEGLGDARLRGLVTELALVETERSVAFESVVLLGSQDTIEAGVTLNAALAMLETPARTADPIALDEWQARSADWLDALNRFQSAARRDLRVRDRFDSKVLAREAHFAGFVGRARPAEPADRTSPERERSRPAADQP